MSGLADGRPLLLCVPGEGGKFDERTLDLPEWRYAIEQHGEVWTVTVRCTGDVIYTGPGPVELCGSPAPF